MTPPSPNLIRFLKPYRTWAILAPACMALEVGLDLLQPRLLQTIIDRGIAHSNMPLVLHTCLWMIGLAAAGLLAGMGCGFFAVLAAQSFGADLRGSLFRKIQSLSFGNLDRLETGPLITRLTSDVTQVQDLVAMLLRIMVRAPLMLIGSLAMAIVTSPRLAFLFLFLIPLVVTALTLIIRRTYPMFSGVQRRLDTLNTVLQENLAGVRVVKAFARADYETGRFSTANDNLMSQNIAVVRVSAMTMPLIMIALNMGIVAALWIGGVRVSAGGMQVGQVIAFINYLMQTLWSLLMVSMLVMQISRAQASARRVQEVLGSEPMVQGPAVAEALVNPQGRVVFQDVSFSYDESEHEPVLKNISFVAEPGQMVAILGATGSGKSSLAKLIPRFYDVTGGRVTIDGADVRTLSEDAFRSTVGVALQESILFSGTIRDNIRYGRPDASEDEVVAAARLAQAHDFISALPEGYDSIVGQRGVNLSGGQKQRIAIARALLIRPLVLVLDDSTSAVDVRTEAAIQEAIASQPFQQTRIIVAQRISTVLNADKILVLNNGSITAEGTHEQLLQSSPVYREIYESQMGNGVITHGD